VTCTCMVSTVTNQPRAPGRSIRIARTICGTPPSTKASDKGETLSDVRRALDERYVKGSR
jgi:hypothetical protein